MGVGDGGAVVGVDVGMAGTLFGEAVGVIVGGNVLPSQAAGVFRQRPF